MTPKRRPPPAENGRTAKNHADQRERQPTGQPGKSQASQFGRIRAIVEATSLTLGERMTLLVLELHADRNAHVAWPSVARIASKTGRSTRQIKRDLERLRALGIIQVVERSHRKTVKYRIHLPFSKGDMGVTLDGDMGVTLNGSFLMDQTTKTSRIPTLTNTWAKTALPKKRPLDIPDPTW